MTRLRLLPVSPSPLRLLQLTPLPPLTTLTTHTLPRPTLPLTNHNTGLVSNGNKCSVINLRSDWWALKLHWPSQCMPASVSLHQSVSSLSVDQCTSPPSLPRLPCTSLILLLLLNLCDRALWLALLGLPPANGVTEIPFHVIVGPGGSGPTTGGQRERRPVAGGAR